MQWNAFILPKSYNKQFYLIKTNKVVKFGLSLEVSASITMNLGTYCNSLRY